MIYIHFFTVQIKETGANDSKEGRAIICLLLHNIMIIRLLLIKCPPTFGFCSTFVKSKMSEFINAHCYLRGKSIHIENDICHM